MDNLLFKITESKTQGAIRWQKRALAAEGKLAEDVAHASERLVEGATFKHLSARVAELEGKIEEWQEASRLQGEPNGDPGDITPKIARKYWHGIETALNQLTCRYVEIDETSNSGKTQWQCTRCDGITARPVKYHKCSSGQWDPDQSGKGESDG